MTMQHTGWGADSTRVRTGGNRAPLRTPMSGQLDREREAMLRALAGLPVDDALARLDTRRSGLTDTEASERAEQVGPNEVAHERPPAWYAQLAHAFWNPFVGILVVLAILSYVTGDISAVVVIGVMVVASGLLRFVQEYRSTKASLALQAMVRTSVTVERTAAVADASSEDAKPYRNGRGRRSEIAITELVPGDIVHVSAGDMIPADVRVLSAKDLFINQSALTGEALPVEKGESLLTTHGTIAVTDLTTVCFMGTSVVSGIGMCVVAATGDRTYFGSLARGLVGRRAVTAFDIGVNKVSWLLIRFMLVMVPVVFVLNGVLKHDWLEAFLFGLAVAVGLTPEMLPMVVTANLAKGAVAMSRRKTIVKRLNAIQNFGAMDVLCTDKTGTLTQDRIVLERHLNAVGEEDENVLALAYVNSAYQTGLKNLLDVAVLEHVELHETLHIDRDYVKVDEIPWDFVRRRMSVVVEQEHVRDLLICKGAVEEVLAVCDRVRDEDRIVPLTDEARTLVAELSAEMNADGLRLVAVAFREFDTHHGAYTVADESELVLAGFIGFLDPPKETAGPALRALGGHGIAVKILTGDSDLVTRKVCRDVGLDVGEIVLGSCVAASDDTQLAALVNRTTVFAKLTPNDKTRVVRALKARGHTVGFLGDGINDAGALREADVGISVDSAVDIAKESADIILLEKSLMVLEEGVIEGRRTFGNIIKYIKMTASSNFGNVFSVLVASAFLPFLPMLPIQLLSQNLLYDFSQTSIPWDDMDPEYLAVPRKWHAGDIGRFMVLIGPTSSVFDMVTFAVMWYVFKANAPAHQALFQSGWFIEGLLSQTLIVHMIRTAKVPFLQSRATLPVLALTTAIMLIGIAIPFTPLGGQLGMVDLPWAYFGWLVVVLGGYMTLTQFVKRWYIRKFGAWL